MQPMLATANDDGASPPSGEAWLHEVKWDGMRVVAEVADGRLRLSSRNGNAVSAAYPELVVGDHSRPTLRPRPHHPPPTRTHQRAEPVAQIAPVPPLQDRRPLALPHAHVQHRHSRRPRVDQPPRDPPGRRGRTPALLTRPERRPTGQALLRAAVFLAVVFFAAVFLAAVFLAAVFFAGADFLAVDVEADFFAGAAFFADGPGRRRRATAPGAGLVDRLLQRGQQVDDLAAALGRGLLLRRRLLGVPALELVGGSSSRPPRGSRRRTPRARSRR